MSSNNDDFDNWDDMRKRLDDLRRGWGDHDSVEKAFSMQSS
jgi:hypothetical protein